MGSRSIYPICMHVPNLFQTTVTSTVLITAGVHCHADLECRNGKAVIKKRCKFQSKQHMRWVECMFVYSKIYENLKKLIQMSWHGLLYSASKIHNNKYNFTVNSTSRLTVSNRWPLLRSNTTECDDWIAATSSLFGLYK